MEISADQQPFLCCNPQQLSPRIRGVFLDIAKEMEPLRKSYCVWAGRNCSFDGILNFVNESATAGYDHRWIASGLLFNYPHRTSANTFPSSSIVDDELRILGPPITTSTPIAEAWNTINKPFTLGSRFLLLGCVILAFIIRVVMSFTYTKTEDGEFDINEFRNRFSDFEQQIPEGW